MGAKLHWKYGNMNSGKSTVLLMIDYDYRNNQNKTVYVTKPYTDKKGGKYITSRIGDMKRHTDGMMYDNINFFHQIERLEDQIDIVMVDEAQFLTKEQVWQLVNIVSIGIPVICFGLRVDFQGNPFEGSSQLFALAQDIEEIGVRSICHCGSRATMVVRFKDEKPIFDGSQISIDGFNHVTYETRCLKHYLELKESAKCI